MNKMWILFWLLNMAVILGGYAVLIRPLLKQRPELASFWHSEDSFFAALAAKFAGLKQKITGAVITIAITTVYMYDSIAPLITGIDVTPLTDKIAVVLPEKYWGIVMIGIILLLNYFRRLAEKRGDI